MAENDPPVGSHFGSNGSHSQLVKRHFLCKHTLRLVAMQDVQAEYDKDTTDASYNSRLFARGSALVVRNGKVVTFDTRQNSKCLKKAHGKLKSACFPTFNCK